jgi:phenylacetate-CoA ligase
MNLGWERSDPAGIRALQFGKLKALLEKTWTVNEFYREHWRRAGVTDIAAIDSLEAFSAKVPTVEKKDFVVDQEACPPFGRRLIHARSTGQPLQFFMTSGTSGQGQELHGQTAAEFKTTGEVYSYMFRWAGMQPGQQVLLTLPLTMMAGGRLEAYGAESYGLTVYPAGNYDAARKLELLARFRPQGIVGTTSYFGHLAAMAATRPPAPSVKALFGGGEGAGLAWYKRLEEEWQARFFDRYGSTQSRNDHMFSCEEGVGESGRPGLLHNIDPFVLFEVVDPASGRRVADGEPGEIILTSLYHTDTPLIRCRMRDTAVFHEGRYCRCGRPFRGIEVGSIGRSDDMHRVKGVNIWPQAVDDLLFSIPEVDEYRVLLATGPTGADVATVQVMPKAATPIADGGIFVERLAARLRERVGVRFEIQLVPPGTLQRSEYKARRWRDERAYKR